MADWLGDNGQEKLVHLIGELIPGSKERVPLQAADLAMWHVRRAATGEADADDSRRLMQMFDGREMTLTEMSNDEITRAAFRLFGSPNLGFMGDVS